MGVAIFQANRELFPDDTQVLYYLYSGDHTLLFSKYEKPSVQFTNLTFHDTPLLDNLTIICTVDGHGTAGYMPVAISPSSFPVVRLMLLPHQPQFDFGSATWAKLKKNAARIWNVISGVAGNPPGGTPEAQVNYERLMKTTPKSIACMLNILTAMDQIQLGGSDTPLDYLKDIRWDSDVKQDRFYCWVDKKLIGAIIEAGSMFAMEPNPSIFHGSTATRSWKETTYSEANVQFTFHEGVVHPANPDWIQLEPDIDYYKDLTAHFFGEVFVNWFGSMTEPAQVYQFRFNDGNLPGSPPFEPPYFIR
jgi:hypothetical protein